MRPEVYRPRDSALPMRVIRMKFVSTFLFGLLIGFGLGRTSIDGLFPIERDVMSELRGPSGVTAIVTRHSAGATTGFVYEIYLKSGRDDFATEDLILRIDRATSVGLQWNSWQLAVCLGNARIWEFTNFRPIKMDDGWQNVSIRLEDLGHCSTTVE